LRTSQRGFQRVTKLTQVGMRMKKFEHVTSCK